MKEFDTQLLAGGAYAKKQLFCSDKIVTWSHQSRFRLARRLVEPFAGRNLIDYGCGDGTFLALVHDLFPQSMGTDIDPHQTEECRDRFTDYPGIKFLLTKELDDTQHHHAYQVVTCMEVLEHCLDEQLPLVIDRLRYLVSDDGTVIVSVPVEIGPSLIGKQIVRTIAGWRRIGDYQYREKYTFQESWRMIFAGKDTEIERPVFHNNFSDGSPNVYHGHKGFNWQTLRQQVQEQFHIQQVLYTPLGCLGRHLNSQVWFICRPN